MPSQASNRVFPSISNPVYPLDGTYKDHTLKMEMDNITVNTRPRFTKTPVTFTLQWTALRASEFSTLYDFYVSTCKGCALPFTWTYPDEPNDPLAGKKYNMRFAGDLSFSLANPGLYTVSVAIEEAV